MIHHGWNFFSRTRVTFCHYLAVALIFLLTTRYIEIARHLNFEIVHNFYREYVEEGESRESKELFLERRNMPYIDKTEPTNEEIASIKTANFTVAVCAIVKDVEAYMQEWIDYYLIALNFDQIYIYDNSDNFELQRWFTNTRHHPIYRSVKVMHFPKKHMQEMAYTRCVDRYGKDEHGPRHDYIALIDYDEYIVLQQPKHDSIHDLLDEYLTPYGGALLINWLYMGSANRTVYSPVPVTKRFQYSDGKPLGISKTIVKSSDFVRMLNPHSAKILPNSNVYDTTFPGSLANLSPTRSGNSKKPSKVVLLYHYRFMSDKEFLIKQCWRYSLSGSIRLCDEKTKTITVKGKSPHLRPRVGKVFDDKAWKFLTRKVPKYKFYDETYIDFS
mmetsp:Transcript_31883/g.63161  ORF Transcript_31883/g.63161 Transcript_31883/m.63161 type:complete len:386 (+) Transcript_31883:166-1323(+)